MHETLHTMFHPGYEPDTEDWEAFEPDRLPDEAWKDPFSPPSLASLAGYAFSEIAFRMPAHRIRAFAALASDPDASEAERYVVHSLVRNAAIAAEGVLPICQDTGTAVVYGWRGTNVNGTTGFAADVPQERDSDCDAFASGAAEAYMSARLRNSQNVPVDMIQERRIDGNLPAAVDIRSVPGDAYRVCFVAKGGGSANRTTFSMESPAILDETLLGQVLRSRIGGLGSSGCPPYRIAAVIGGSTPSQALYTLELASAGLLDDLSPDSGGSGAPLRDRSWETTILAMAAHTGVGAQFGRIGLAIDARAIRLPRHAASLPLCVGVSCSAHRSLRAFGTARGWYVERMERDPARYLPKSVPVLPGAVRIHLDGPPGEVAARFSTIRAGAFVLLSGTVVIARDAAHARFRRVVESGADLPDYLKRHPVFYAGPTEAAPGQVSGSFGPTTAGRMDAYLELLFSHGAHPVTIAKGGRSAGAAGAIRVYGGTYLACIGGAAALAAREHVRSSHVIDFADLGMEAVRLVEINELPAMVAIDSSGASFP